MKKLLPLILFFGFASTALALSVLTTPQGGTGWGRFTADTLLTGNGTGQIATTTIGSGLSLSGGTLTATAVSGSPFPFTQAAYGVSTSTIVGFLGGMLTLFRLGDRMGG